jgi:predicted TIM-barrel fold metal-dependent hydrolase
MIIDAHSHIWEEKLISGDLKNLLEALTVRFNPDDPSQIRNGTIDRLIGEMDEAGIDKTVLLGLDVGLAFTSDLGVREYNDYVADIVREHPDRIIGFAGIDPRRGKEGVGELQRCFEMGLRGLKLWTLTGFYPDDEAYYPLYEKVAELGIPILAHTGSGPPKTYMKFNKPLYVDKVAVDFPEIKIIMAHIGMPWIDEAVAIVIKNPNVYVDLSAWETVVKAAPVALCQAMAQIKMATGSLRQVLFGSDWPLFTPLMSLKEWVEAIQTLEVPPPLQMMGLQDFTEEDKRLILGENAAEVLGL